MSQSTANKGNKMSFDQYHSKLFNKITNTNNIKANGSNKSNVKQAIGNKVSYAGHHQQVTSVTYQDSKSKLPHTYKSTHQANPPHKPLHNPSTNPNYQPVTLPISHTLQPPPQQHQQRQSSSTQIKKIDLIFEKQPQQVQNKLRMLLLNYNAVMQYNQSEDRFEVDLLLPFQSVQQQQAFVQRFEKTRKQIRQQMQKRRSNQVQLRDSSIINNYQQHQQAMGDIYQQQQEDGNNSKQQCVNEQMNKQTDRKQYRTFSNENNALDTKRLCNTARFSHHDEGDDYEQSRVDNINIEQQVSKQQEQIDFYALDESLDGAIKRAMQLIRPKLIIGGERIYGGEKLFSSGQQQQSGYREFDQRANMNNNHEQQHDYNSQQTSQQQSFIPQHDPDHPTTPQPQQSTYTSANKSHQAYLSNNRHYDNNNNNFYSDGSDEQTVQNHHHLQGYGINDQLISSPQSTMRVQGVANILYHHHRGDRYRGISSNSGGGVNVVYSNGMLIGDDSGQQQDVIEQSQYQLPLHRNQFVINNYSQMQQQQLQVISLGDDDDMVMIEQTSQEESEEEQQQVRFISPKEYQNFLKRKINSIAVNSNPQQQHNVSRSSAIATPAFSSFRKDYAQFLKKNHKRIQKLYLRIGKQLINNGIHSNKSYSRNQIKSQSHKRHSHMNDDYQALGDFKRRIAIENQQMSSQDKVRYFRYLAKNAKRLYIEHIKSHSPSNRVNHSQLLLHQK